MSDWRDAARRLKPRPPGEVPVVAEWCGLLDYMRDEELVELKMLAGRCLRTPADTLELLEQAAVAGEVRIYAAKVAR